MIKQSKHIFLVGIGGIAMFNLAIILKKMGKIVSGSDAPSMTMTDVYLEQNNIPFQKNFEIENLPAELDLVIYSGSHNGENNPQVVEAKKRGVATIPLAVANGELGNEFENVIAICGCHGKTTTSSLIANTLKDLEQHPSYLIGTGTFNENFGGDFDGSKYFVIEADEYGVNPPRDNTPKFMHIFPTHIVCTNIDFDHPDIYADLNAVKAAYTLFFEQSIAKKNAKLFLCADNVALMEVAQSLPRERYTTFGYTDKADLRIINSTADENQTKFEVESDTAREAFTLSIFGEKNVSNAAAVVALLADLGFPVAKIQSALSTFTGAKRRFEQVAQINTNYLFDDYAHHPDEIKATINAARQRFPSRHIIVLFQPHTYTRTFALKDEFVEALSLADHALILPIYASAREKDDGAVPISSEDLEKLAQKRGFSAVSAVSNERVIQALTEVLKRNDVVITMGAGDVYQMKDGIIQIMKNIT